MSDIEDVVVPSSTWWLSYRGPGVVQSKWRFLGYTALLVLAVQAGYGLGTWLTIAVIGLVFVLDRKLDRSAAKGLALSTRGKWALVTAFSVLTIGLVGLGEAYRQAVSKSIHTRMHALIEESAQEHGGEVTPFAKFREPAQRTLSDEVTAPAGTIVDPWKPSAAPISDSIKVMDSWNQAAMAWEEKNADFMADPSRAQAMREAVGQIDANTNAGLSADGLLAAAQREAFAKTAWGVANQKPSPTKPTITNSFFDSKINQHCDIWTNGEVTCKPAG